MMAHFTEEGPGVQTDGEKGPRDHREEMVAKAGVLQAQEAMTSWLQESWVIYPPTPSAADCFSIGHPGNKRWGTKAAHHPASLCV